MDELALLDLPSQIDFVLKTSGQKSLGFIGHSQGCTLSVMLLAAKPEYNKKIWLLMMLGAVTHVQYIAAPFLRQQVKTRSTQLFADMGVGEFAMNRVSNQVANGCKYEGVRSAFCSALINFAVSGAGRSNAGQTTLDSPHVGPSREVRRQSLMPSGRAAKTRSFALCTRGPRSHGTPPPPPPQFYGSSTAVSPDDLVRVSVTWASGVATRNLLHWSQQYYANVSGLRMWDYGTECAKSPGFERKAFQESCNQVRGHAPAPSPPPLRPTAAPLFRPGCPPLLCLRCTCAWPLARAAWIPLCSGYWLAACQYSRCIQHAILQCHSLDAPAGQVWDNDAARIRPEADNGARRHLPG
jgi:hypothetical protein